MAIEFKPHRYQKIAIDHALEHPRSGLFLDMGLGKTVTTLTVIDKLMFEELEVSRVLIIAPKRVAEDTWSTEVAKWEHLNHLKISKVLGNVSQRRKALSVEADIYITNRENVVWLTNELSNFGDGWMFDMVVIDELSSFKASKSQRFKALKKFIQYSDRVIGLTGTPSPNGLMDLWSQMYLIDGGERLGKTIKHYRDKFFFSEEQHFNKYVFKYTAKPNAETKIHEAISDIVISMTADDWLEMPERIDNVVSIKLDNKERSAYERFEKESYLAIADGEKEISAVSKGVLINKLLQFCNGAVYTEDKEAIKLSDKKLEALSEIIETSNGKPVLVFYSFKSDKDRIMKKYKEAETLEDSSNIARWNNGEIPILLAHPASAGHGLNLQYGGNIIVWFGLTWSLELYQQANARLHRQGQTESTIIHHLLIEDTVEQKVLARLQEKEEVQNDLIEYLKAKYEAYDEGR